MDFHNLINNGGFGMSGPIQNYYSTNMIPFGNEGYYNQQLGYGANVQQPQQYVFNPVNQQLGYDINVQQQYVQQPQQYVFSPVNQQQQFNQFGGDYYNPYGNQPMQYQQNYTGMYSYPAYMNPMQQMQNIHKMKEIDKIQYRIRAGFFGREIDEEKLNRAIETKYNPNAIIDNKTEEEKQQDEDWNTSCELYNRSVTGNYAIPMQAKSIMINLMMNNIQKEMGSHSMFEFFQNDLPKIKHNDWVGKHINLNSGRDLRSTYDSSEYNQLISLHSRNNPFINSLLDDSKYDNVYEDEMGMKVSIDKETNRLKFIRDKLPTYISSEETQKRRRDWTNAILEQIYKKENSC